MRKQLFMLGLIACLLGVTGCNQKNENITTEAVTDKIEVESKTSETEAESSTEETNGLNFSTTDINGHPIRFEDVKNAKLIMVNFWEPWCGPCVGEMPELEKLYENYKEKGLIILGVFFTGDSDEDVKAVVDSNHISYPIVYGNQDFMKYTSEYVPTTVFFDSNGD